MPVAKTYSDMEIQGEPFEENKRMYINVLTPKGIKKVRWYTDTEYCKMYHSKETTNDIMDFNARYAFGFGELGYIWIYSGNDKALEEFVEYHHESFRRNLTFGYYTPSHLCLCALPNTIIPIKLTWEEVVDHDNRMRPHEEVQKIVQNKLSINSNSSSQFQGEINTWLEKDVCIKEVKTNTSYFGEKHTYIMVDDKGNTYIWNTGAKNYSRDTALRLKMKVKAHEEYNGEKCTIVWYCKEI